MPIAWEDHKPMEPDWLDAYEDDELSRFGALTPIIRGGALIVGCVGFYYLCVGLLWVGLRLSR